MFGKRVSALIWNDPRRPGDSRTRFVANYIFDDGFSSISECSKHLNNPSHFVYVEFNKQFYAVCCQEYHDEIVVTAENIYHRQGSWQRDVLPVGRYYLLATRPHYMGDRAWRDGIYQDLLRIDPDICVYDSSSSAIRDAVTVINTIIAFGLNFFTNEICIKTDAYLDKVLSHYFSKRSMDYYKKDDIVQLRAMGVNYWNPYNTEHSRTDSERKKKQRARERGLDMGPIIDDREAVDGVKFMDESDLTAYW